MTSEYSRPAFVTAGLKHMRVPGPGSVILEPFAKDGRGVISSVSGCLHLACEQSPGLAQEYHDRWPDYDLNCGDVLEWLDSGFYASMDVVAVDFDAGTDPTEAISVFMRHVKPALYCLAFVTWTAPELEKVPRAALVDSMGMAVARAAAANGISLKLMGTAAGGVGEVYGAFSLVIEGGTHPDGVIEMAGEARRPPEDESGESLPGVLDLESRTPEQRREILGRLQFTPAEIERFETGGTYDRAVLVGEAEMRWATFQSALAGDGKAQGLMAKIISKRRYHERLEDARSRLRQIEEAKEQKE